MPSAGGSLFDSLCALRRRGENMEHFEVDRCLAELEAEDERQKEAVRKMIQRDRSFKVDWPLLGIWAAILAFIGLFYGFTIAWLYPLIHRLLARLGLL
jgi:hypothetical protein